MTTTIMATTISTTTTSTTTINHRQQLLESSVPGTMLSAQMNHFILFLQLFCDVGIIIIHTLEMRRLRPGEAESLTQVMLTAKSDATPCHNP